MLNRTAWEARITNGVREMPRQAWTRLFPNEVEGWDYYAACEANPPHGFSFFAAGIWSGSELIAAAPVFSVTYRLDTPIQGRLRPAADWLYRNAAWLVEHKVMGFGSPLAERAHIGFDPELDPDQRGVAAAQLIAALDAHAAASGAMVLAVKDLADRELFPIDRNLAEAGFARVASLPVAVLDLSFGSEAEYFASLSAATRKDIRRKLRHSGGRVRIEQRVSLDGVEPQVRELYAQTRVHSKLDYGDFEELAPSYFGDVSRALGPRAVFMLYWVGDTLVAFNLLLVEPARVIDKFLGMRYPLAQQHNLYVVSWMTNVRFCLDRGIGTLQTGQTAYAAKLHMGSRLEKSWVYFRHRGRITNWLFRTFSPLLAFDKMDPDLGGKPR